MNKHLLIVKANLDKRKAGITAALAQASIKPEDKTKLDAAMAEIEAGLKALDDADAEATNEEIMAVFTKAMESLMATQDVQMASDIQEAQAKLAVKFDAELQKLQAKIDAGTGSRKKFSAKLSLSRANKSTEAKDSENFRSFSAGVDVESWTPEAEIDNVEIFRPMIGVAGAIDTSLNILDTVVSKELAYHDVANEILVRFHPWMEHPYFIADQDILNKIILANADDKTVSEGKIVTGEVFIDQDGREAIIEKYNPQCVDMETASVAHV